MIREAHGQQLNLKKAKVPRVDWHSTTEMPISCRFVYDTAGYGHYWSSDQGVIKLKSICRGGPAVASHNKKAGLATRQSALSGQLWHDLAALPRLQGHLRGTQKVKERAKGAKEGWRSEVEAFGCGWIREEEGRLTRSKCDNRRQSKERAEQESRGWDNLSKAKVGLDWKSLTACSVSLDTRLTDRPCLSPSLKWLEDIFWRHPTRQSWSHNFRTIRQSSRTDW